jgi:hypothetical protein
MKRKAAVSALRKDVALTKRYGKIGISAVAAAARYQGKGNNENSPAVSRAESKRADASKIRKGTSPKR